MSLAGGLARLRNGAEFQVTVATPAPRGNHDDAALPFVVIRQPGFMRLLRLIREADVIHIAGPALLPMFLARLLGKPWVVEHHGFQTICPNGQLVQNPESAACPGHFMAGRHGKCVRCNASEGRLVSLRMWLLTFVRRWLARKARINITPTMWLGTQLGLPRMQTILHGLAAASEPRDGLERTPPVFFFLGRLVPTKGVQILIEAVSHLRNDRIPFQLRIAGDGPERAALTARVESAGLADCTEFLGKVTDARTSQEMERATATVMPSIGGEVFGLVALESMFRGCPVVASDIGALREVIGDAGMVFPIGDGRELAARLATLARSTQSAAGLRRKARERALKCFGEDRMVEEHSRVFRSLTRKTDAEKAER